MAAAFLSGSAAVAHAQSTEATEELERLRRDWIQVRTPSVRVYAEAGLRPDGVDLQRLEAIVQRLCERLDVDLVSRASLMRQPIEYVLTRDTALIDRVTGIRAEGAAFASRRLILATTLPHVHELTHVIMHLALGTKASGNVSFLEEGLASAIGGHAGEAPLAVMVTADEILARQSVPLERFFTESGFDRGPFTAHERYAIAARFVDYLLRERGGWSRLREVLTILAGEPAEIRRRPLRATLLQLEGVYGTTFEKLEADFRDWVRNQRVERGMRTLVPRRDPDVTARDERHRITCWFEEDGDWVIEIGALFGTLGARVTWGQIPAGHGAWQTAPRPTHRFELEVDRTGATLREQRDGQLLMRWSVAQGQDPLRTVARLRVDARELGLRPPDLWSVWSYPEFPAYRSTEDVTDARDP